jgi:hypothetical protein
VQCRRAQSSNSAQQGTVRSHNSALCCIARSPESLLCGIAWSSVADPGCFIPDPGSGSLTFLSRIWIRGVKKHRIPDLGSRILMYRYIKIGMKNKTNFFLAFLVSGASFITGSKKIKEQRFLRKSHQKTYPLDPGSGKNSSRTKGVKKHRIPDPQHWRGVNSPLSRLVRSRQEKFLLEFHTWWHCTESQMKLFLNTAVCSIGRSRNLALCSTGIVRSQNSAVSGIARSFWA